MDIMQFTLQVLALFIPVLVLYIKQNKRIASQDEDIKALKVRNTSLEADIASISVRYAQLELDYAILRAEYDSSLKAQAGLRHGF